MKWTLKKKEKVLKLYPCIQIQMLQQIKLKGYLLARAKHLQIYFFKIQAKLFSDKLDKYQKCIIHKFVRWNI